MRLRSHASKAALALGAVVIVLGLLYAPLLYQESHGHPLPYLQAMVKLELRVANLVAVTPDATIFMQKCCPQPLHQPLTDFLGARGWIFQDQMGAGLFYERGTARLTIISRMFSRRYVVYDLDRAP